MATKPVTTYSKAYVIERIEARKTSLNATIARANEAMQQWWSQQDEAMNAAYQKRREEMQAVLDSMGQMERQFAAATSPQEKYEALRLTSRIGFSYLPNVPSSGRAKTGSLPDLLQEKEQAEKELAILDHTLAYFRETPVDEFTLTALQKLGLLNAVKFSIPA